MVIGLFLTTKEIDMNEIYVVIEGGCVQYIASNNQAIKAYVVDLDDIKDDPDGMEDQSNVLRVADQLPRIW